MNKKIKYLLATLLVVPLAGCSSNKKEEQKTIANYVYNGGFETSDLSGWTIEYGDAYNDDSVSSREDFYFANDDKHNIISLNKTGNWFLSGQGFNLKHHHGRTGAIRSNNFFLTDDGFVSMKLAGGALTQGKGEEAAYKKAEEVCYVGIYLASTDQMIARQTNEYFLEGTEDFIDAMKYKNGVYHTDNFCEYTIDLSAYANQECYMRIVDNDKSVYYGYLSVDDIRIGDGLPQEDGQYYVKTKQYAVDVEAKDKYHIKNPDFEVGSLGGWTIVEGEAFSHDGVNTESMYWNESIPFNRDGNYHYGFYNPTATGVLRSSVFTLGGKGYISFKLGGCQDRSLTFIRVMDVNGGEPVEIARFSNEQFNGGDQFPYIPMKMHHLNMVQYYINLNEFIGEDLYFEMVDNNISGNDEGCMTFDSFETYYESTPYWKDKEYYFIDTSLTYEREPVNEYQVPNGTFETGDLTGWVKSGNIGVVTDKSYWWDNANLPVNKRGTYLFSGEEHEGGTGTLTSSSFVVGGIGYMTFRMSGGRDPLACYVAIIDASTNEELLRFANYMFNDMNTDRIGQGSHLMDMILYKADVSSLNGRTVKIKVVDNATNNWGLICVDSFITYYETADAISAEALYTPNTLAFAEQTSPNQVLNGTFEMGDATGWTFSSANHILDVSRDYTWWYECYLYNKQGSFFVGPDFSNGQEANTGTMTSSSFLLGGCGFVTYRLGGGKNRTLCHVEFLDADNADAVIATTYNQMFHEMGAKHYYMGYPQDLSTDGVYLANMAQYKVDLHEYIGHNIKIRLVDNATNEWGLLTADEFITYYASEAAIPSSYILAEKL